MSVPQIRFSLRTGGPRPQEVVEYVAGAAIAFKATRLGFFSEKEGERAPVAAAYLSAAYLSDPPQIEMMHGRTPAAHRCPTTAHR